MIKFFKNIWFFRRELYKYRNFDHHYCTMMFLKSLKGLRDGIKKRQNHVDWKEDYQNISRTIRIIERYYKDSFAFDLAKRIVGGEPEIVIVGIENSVGTIKFRDQKLSTDYYKEVERIQSLLKEKAVAILLKNYEAWWD